MPKEEWLKAADQFRQQAKDDKTARRREDSRVLKQNQAQKDAEEDLRRRKAVGVMALEQFMESDEGEAAKKLLAAGKRFIRFAEEGDSQMTTVYFMDGNGLQVCHEAAASMSNAYAVLSGNKLPEAQRSVVTAEVIVEAVMNYSKLQPEEIVTFIRKVLDNTAALAQR